MYKFLSLERELVKFKELVHNSMQSRKRAKETSGVDGDLQTQKSVAHQLSVVVYDASFQVRAVSLNQPSKK